MSSFEQTKVEIPQSSPWDLVTGSIVLMFGTFGGAWLLGWLILV